MEIGRLLTIQGLAILGLAAGAAVATANPSVDIHALGNTPPISTRQSTIDRLVAVVGGEPIFLSDVREVVRLRLLDPSGPLVPAGADATGGPIDEALARMINRRVVLAEVARYSQAPPAAADVDAAVRAWATRFPEPPPHDPALVRAFLSDSLRIASYIDQRFTAAAMVQEWLKALRDRAAVRIIPLSASPAPSPAQG